ncbi:MAG TPA: UDP-N-acetylenolpyruvoylglucosamine reductase, partial [Candidatus Omnitrophota bacterium]|nr:UDP-N-acetylenolpyruvoylglucosamine reductase [Candidatus Omnitrophota bacterium]
HGVKGWAGSFFRNPPGQFAGLLIDKTGLKGLKIGGAEVSAVHANFLINSGGAAADDFIALIKKVKQSVREQFNVELKLEVKLAGFTEEEKKEL